MVTIFLFTKKIKNKKGKKERCMAYASPQIVVKKGIEYKESH